MKHMKWFTWFFTSTDSSVLYYSHLFCSYSFFKQKVSKSRSAVKISDQVMRDDPLLIDAVFWSSGLDDIFKENLKNDPELRYIHTYKGSK